MCLSTNLFYIFQNSKLKKQILSIIHIHAPTNEALKDQPWIVEQFYSQLNELFNQSIVMMLGDFNAKTGIPPIKSVHVGQFVKGEQNGNGLYLFSKIKII